MNMVPMDVRKERGPIAGYLMALVLSALALGVTFRYNKELDAAVFNVFFAAVSISAWYGGLGPGLFASVLSAAALDYFVFEPRGTFQPGDPAEYMRLGFFLFVAIMASSLSDSLRRARHRAERAAARADRLQTVTEALSVALTAPEVAKVIISQGMQAMGASTAVVALVTASEDELEIVDAVGLPSEAMSQWRHFAVSSQVPLAKAARASRPVYFDMAAEFRSTQHAAVNGQSNPGIEPGVALPLVAGGRVFGSCAFTFADRRSFDDADQSLILALSRQCAQALERARLYEAEQRTRAEATRARSAAEAASKAKSEFLAKMSHEMRTPLNAIAGYVELLEMGLRGPINEEQRSDLERIRRSEQHLLGLINDVLDLARIEAGRLDLVIEDVSVHDVMAVVGELVEPQWRAKGLSCEWVPCERTLRVRADRDRVHQILLNLLANAVKFTEPGGRIHVSCVASDDDAHGDQVRLMVRDTGRGIPEEHLQAIFLPFVQVDRRLNKPTEGTGLGLAISRDLARAMNGDLTVESEIGVGSTFIVSLPRAAGVATAGASSAAPGAGQENAPRDH
jgi:signal transduction histidine kinase